MLRWPGAPQPYGHRSTVAPDGGLLRRPTRQAGRQVANSILTVGPH